MNILSKINSINDVKSLNFDELNILKEEIRDFLIDTVSETGGHLASNLGVVELTLALHKVYDVPKDKLVWDVGHQTYVHKIITGRKDKFNTLRQYEGLSGFPKSSESNTDAFNTGHSSTSVSAALGYAKARDILNQNYNVVAIIGDGSLTGGMAFEALNDAGRSKENLTVILNDNEMSIEENVGGLSKYLNRIRTEPLYYKAKGEISEIVSKIPTVGANIKKTLVKAKDSIRYIALPGSFFEELGFTYIGPIDGHDIEGMCEVLGKAKNIKGPVLIHVITKKGKGYTYAEEDPSKFHSIAPFEKYSGELRNYPKITFSSMFGRLLTDEADVNDNVVAVTASMVEGTGLLNFKERYPDRIFDVGIAEQHAVTFAAGLAKAGLKPFVALYSTFLQRAYDQIVHDVALQKLPVVFMIDRAGIVGADGETHQGIFDISFLSSIPNMIILSPRNYDELERMFRFAVNYYDGPVAIRYPKGEEQQVEVIKDEDDENYQDNNDILKWEKIQDGRDITIIASGLMVSKAKLIANELKTYKINVEVVNARCIKPIDMEYIDKILPLKKDIYVLEDNIMHGGLGSMILDEVFQRRTYTKKIKTYAIDDMFVPHGSIGKLHEYCHIDVKYVSDDIRKDFKRRERQGKKNTKAELNKRKK